MRFGDGGGESSWDDASRSSSSGWILIGGGALSRAHIYHHTRRKLRCIFHVKSTSEAI